MAWVLPTASDVKAAISALTDVPNAQVEASLAMAGVEVMQAYPNQTIFNRAVQLYVAHDLTVQGIGSSPEAQLALTASLNSASDGASSFTRKQATSNQTDSPFRGTSFGLRYLDLVRRYRSPFIGLGEKS
jgi:hypothetical protein